MDLTPSNVLKRYLFDTNMLIGLERFRKDESKVGDGLKTFLRQILLNENVNIALSVISLAEIVVLMDYDKDHWKEPRTKSMIDIVSQMRLLPLSNNLIQHYINLDLYARERKVSVFNKRDNTHYLIQKTATNHKPQPHKLGKNDLWIAATACEHDCCLVTSDKKDFRHLLDYPGLEMMIIDYQHPDANKI
jgi:predicted nucleic acid-binding protein